MPAPAVPRSPFVPPDRSPGWGWRRPRAAVVRILMVVDAGISYDRDGFSLSTVLRTLANDERSWVRFEVTRAHRGDSPPSPSTVDLPGFRFDQDEFDISDYDQVWFFGFEGEGAPGLSDDELNVLVPWMERGGGVFATGDHATLGAALCKRIPRVRRMRKWTSADGVPPAGGPSRHDTLVRGHDSVYTFDDESDDTPMRLRVKRFNYGAAIGPHPVLCGRDGVINQFPDHPHEGEVRADDEVVLTGTLDAGPRPDDPEFPLATNAKPEVIAWARVQWDHTDATDLNKGAADADRFGAVGVYDGHKVRRGRIVVDSTWHHWFDINLVGRPSFFLDSVPPDPRKLRGFLDTPAGEKVLDGIKDYFVNVAVWLSSAAKIAEMRQNAMWNLVIQPSIQEELAGALPFEVFVRARPVDVLGMAAGRCRMHDWYIPVFIQEGMVERPKIPGPDEWCLTCPPWERFAEIHVASLLAEVAEVAKGGPLDDEALGKRLAAALQAGERSGVERIAALESERLEATVARSQAFMARLERAR